MVLLWSRGTLAHWSLLLPTKSLSFFFCYCLILFWIFLFCLISISLQYKQNRGNNMCMQKHTHTHWQPLFRLWQRPQVQGDCVGFQTEMPCWIHPPSPCSIWCIQLLPSPWNVTRTPLSPSIFPNLDGFRFSLFCAASSLCGVPPGGPRGLALGFTALPTPTGLVSS